MEGAEPDPEEEPGAWPGERGEPLEICRAMQRGTLKKDSGRHCKVRAGGQCGRDRLRAPGHAGEDPRKTEDAAAHMEEARGPEDMHAHGTPERDPGIKGMRMDTSALAYDGSGKVERDPGNHSLCTFGNGKRYNCDLSASYNIGARYFIRELTKPMPATAWSVLEAEVPAVRRRSSCVHADLVRLSAVMRENGWTA